jgi:TolB-like protein/DNA-binding SARP family transcriptional activator
MASLALCLLGDFQVRLSSGGLLTVRGRKAQGLLACLAASPGNSLTRDKLAAILWGDHDDEHARNSLRQTLTALRRDLAAVEPFPLDVGRVRLALAKDAVDVDVWNFEQLAASANTEDLEHAAALYRGDFLDGMHMGGPAFEEWSSGERERLRLLIADTLERLAACQSGAKALATAQRLLALDPLREASYRIVMRAYASQGETDLALRKFEECRDTLRRELQVEPDAATAALYCKIRDERAVRILAAPFVRDASERSLPDLPQKPAVALLPFGSTSGDPEQQEIGDAATEDIITELSRFHGLSVAARSSSFQYRGKAIDVKRLGRELGVSYVVEGSVRTIGPRIRISAQLLDATTGGHLWAERYDRDRQGACAVDDDVVVAIAVNVARQIEAVAIAKSRCKPTDTLQAYDYFLQGMEHCRRSGSEDIGPACSLFQKAIDLDPGLARAYAAFSLSAIDAFWADAYKPGSTEKMLDRAFEAAARAVALDGSDAQCHRALANAHISRRAFERAKYHLDLAMALNPNDPKVAASRSWYEVCAGRGDAVLALLERAERLDPYPPNWMWGTRGQALYRLGRYDDALAAFDRMTAAQVWIDRFRAACFAQLGRRAEARSAAAAALRREPRFTLRRYAMVEPCKSPADLAHLIDGMRRAGLPE